MAVFGVFRAMALNKSEKHLFEWEHLKILFSMYLIVFYENKTKCNEKLNGLYEKVQALFADIIKEYKSSAEADPNDYLYKYFRLLKAVLINNKYAEAAKMFDSPDYKHGTGIGAMTSESEYPSTVLGGHWILARPGLQVNAYYYNELEMNLGIEGMNLY
jgi:hypothetical protein